MIILGLNHGEYNSSAAIVVDGELIAAVAEERFSRDKKTKSFPLESVRYCLKQANVQIADCDAIAQGWNAGAGWLKYNPMISATRIRREDYFYSIPDHLMKLQSERDPGDWVKQEFAPETGLPPLYHIQHHRAHVANAFFLSPFQEAAFFTSDWRGEFECLTMGTCNNSGLNLLRSQRLPHSLGMFYATFTELLGYKPDNDEWKVMALSAYNIDAEKELRKLRETVALLPDGRFELDQTYYQGVLAHEPTLYTDKLRNLMGGKVGLKGEDPSEWHIRVARAMQQMSEEIASHCLTHLHSATGMQNLVVAGGFFMNSVYNGKLLQQTPFREVYIPYAPDDLGNSIGAAMYVYHWLLGGSRTDFLSSSYLGPDFSDQEIEEVLQRRGIAYKRLQNPEQETAKLLAEGHVVARLNGKMEFGERALGNRSILGDPRNLEMKDRINSMIKYREGYRPFAPSVLSDRCQQYFDVQPMFQDNYMEKVVPVRTEHRQYLPAITHLDGSARVQTVDPTHNPSYAQLLQEFEKVSGYPIILNTSFNTNGEPIVMSPDDALNTFFNSGLTHLVMGPYLVKKERT